MDTTAEWQYTYIYFIFYALIYFVVFLFLSFSIVRRRGKILFAAPQRSLYKSVTCGDCMSKEEKEEKEEMEEREATGMEEVLSSSSVTRRQSAELLDFAVCRKVDGNEFFKEKEYTLAIDSYSRAIEVCPKEEKNYDNLVSFLAVQYILFLQSIHENFTCRQSFTGIGLLAIVTWKNMIKLSKTVQNHWSSNKIT